MSKKNVAAVKATGKGFDAAGYAAKFKLSEDDVLQYKQSFDLFDTDQGGSIDTKGTSSPM